MPFSGGAICKNRRLAAAVNRLLDTHVLAHFHTASALSAPSLRLPFERKAIKLRKSLATQRLASPIGGSAEGNRGMLAVYRAMLNSPTLSIFQHFHAIPLRSPLISLRSKWRLTGFSRRFTPKNPVRLHKPFGQLPRWGAKNVLPLNLIALPSEEGCDTRIPSSKKGGKAAT